MPEDPEIAANLKKLAQEIERQAYVPDTWSFEFARLPLAPISTYFAKGITPEAVGNSQIVDFGIDAFVQKLHGINERPDVSDIKVEFHVLEEGEDWPDHMDFLISTAAEREEILGWLAGVEPNEILLVGGSPKIYVKAREVRVEELTSRPGDEIWALRYHYDLDQ